MTEPTKTAENPRLELAIADAMRENIESTRIMDHVEPLKKVVEAYAAQQVTQERERIKKALKNKILRDGKISSITTIDELIDSL